MTGTPENAANPSTDALPLKRSVRNSYQNRAVHRSKWWVVLCKVLFVAGLLGAGADYLLASVLNPTRLASPPEKDPAALEVSPTLGAERPKRTLREYPASVARFPGDMPVIGVTSGIEHRAYILQTLKDIGGSGRVQEIDDRVIQIAGFNEEASRLKCGRTE